MTRARLKLIRDAARRDVSAEEWRERMDEWMNLDTITIKWKQTVRTFETNWPALFRAFKRNLIK